MSLPRAAHNNEKLCEESGNFSKQSDKEHYNNILIIVFGFNYRACITVDLNIPFGSFAQEIIAV